MQQIPEFVHEEAKGSPIAQTVNQCPRYYKNEGGQTQSLLLTFILLFNMEEYSIDNLINEARFFIDHRDDNETYLS